MCLKASRSCEDYVTSITLGHDMVARMSTPNLLKVKHQISLALTYATASKWQALSVS